jgi:hypothetical protein
VPEGWQSEDSRGVDVELSGPEGSLLQDRVLALAEVAGGRASSRGAAELRGVVASDGARRGSPLRPWDDPWPFNRPEQGQLDRLERASQAFIRPLRPRDLRRPRRVDSRATASPAAIAAHYREDASSLKIEQRDATPLCACAPTRTCPNPDLLRPASATTRWPPPGGGGEDAEKLHGRRHTRRAVERRRKGGSAAPNGQGGATGRVRARDRRCITTQTTPEPGPPVVVSTRSGPHA